MESRCKNVDIITFRRRFGAQKLSQFYIYTNKKRSNLKQIRPTKVKDLKLYIAVYEKLYMIGIWLRICLSGHNLFH